MCQEETLLIMSNVSFCHNGFKKSSIDMRLYVGTFLGSTWRSVQTTQMDSGALLINPFPDTTILQQTTLDIFCQQIENLYNWMDINLRQIVENIVAKGEIARSEQFLLLSLLFSNSRLLQASQNIYIRERVNWISRAITLILFLFLKETLHTTDSI